MEALTELNNLLTEIKTSTEPRRKSGTLSDEESDAFSTLVFLMEECARRRANTRYETTKSELLVTLLHLVRDYHQEWIAKPAGLQIMYI